MRLFFLKLMVLGIVLSVSGCHSCRPLGPVTFPAIGRDPLDLPCRRSGPLTWGPAYYGPLRIGGLRLGLTGYAPVQSNVEGWMQHMWMTAP